MAVIDQGFQGALNCSSKLRKGAFLYGGCVPDRRRDSLPWRNMPIDTLGNIINTNKYIFAEYLSTPCHANYLHAYYFHSLFVTKWRQKNWPMRPLFKLFFISILVKRIRIIKIRRFKFHFLFHLRFHYMKLKKRGLCPNQQHADPPLSPPPQK